MQHRIIVLGAGYAGAVTAGRLAKRLSPEDVVITLVNDGPDFVERVRNHQVAAGQDIESKPLAEMFAGTGVRLKIARVESVDVERQVVTTDRGDETYDTLVYALGSIDNGTPADAYQIAGRTGARELRDRLARLGAGQTVVVVGGGLTGLEAATELAEARTDLDVALAVRDGLADWLAPRARDHVRKVFARRKITVYEHTVVTRVEKDHVQTEGGGVIPAAVTVWTTGFAAHPIAKATTLEVTDTGRIVVDATMRSVSHPHVYAVGDAAYAMGVTGKPLRMSCASGVPMAWQAADAIAARLTGAKVPETSLRFYNQCISLGRTEGVIQYVTSDDRAVRAALTGRIAALYKELVCKGALWGVANPTLGIPSRKGRVSVSPGQETGRMTQGITDGSSEK